MYVGYASYGTIFVEMRPYFEFTKEFPKNTKENIYSGDFCSHFSPEGIINLIASPDCCTSIAVSIDTHIGRPQCHIAMQLYGHIAKIWLAIWPYRNMAFIVAYMGVYGEGNKNAAIR